MHIKSESNLWMMYFVCICSLILLISVIGSKQQPVESLTVIAHAKNIPINNRISDFEQSVVTNTLAIDKEIIKQDNIYISKPIIIEETTRSQKLNNKLDPIIVDEEYLGGKVNLSSKDRILVEKIVMSEAEGEGYEGQLLVAQCVRDAILIQGFKDVNSLLKEISYSTKPLREPNDSVKEAIDFIFVEGGYAVQHPIYYFYKYKTPRRNKVWHESQLHILTYKEHKFFCTNK